MEETVLGQVEEKIKDVIKDGVKRDNVDYLYKLVDIHKDLKNEEYWKKKEEKLDEIQRKLWSKNERQQRSLHGRLWQKL